MTKNSPTYSRTARVLIRSSMAILCAALMYLMAAPVKAQRKSPPPKNDTAKTEPVYVNADVLTTVKTDSEELTKFIGKAIFIQGTDTLYCDSLYKHSLKNIYEAFSNVRLAQTGGTQGTCSYLRYTAADKQAYMTGNVILTDGKNSLHCEELTYNMGTKTGVYDKGGTLYSDSTIVTSTVGTYNANTKDSRFQGNVHIFDPRYKIKSEDVAYNTETKFESFYAHSIITSDSGKSVLETSDGTYDSKMGIAHFYKHSGIWDDGEFIEGDTLNYNKTTGFGLAIGHVKTIDTAHHSTMYCGRLEYYQYKKVLWATIKPVLQQVNGKDTLYMRADTFYSAPMRRMKVPVKNIRDSLAKGNDSLAHKVTDSLQGKGIQVAALPAAAQARDTLAAQTTPVTEKEKAGRRKKSTIAKEEKDTKTRTVYVVPGNDEGPVTKKKHRQTSMKERIMSDTAKTDTTAPLYFIGYHHVKIFSDSLQGKCDSVCYTRSDSTVRMMYAPITWAHNSQITGDTILIHLDTNEVRSMYVPNNAFVISQSGPAKARLFDQVQGRTLTAYFKNNQIVKAVVFPNAEAIYYPTDEKGAYLGLNESKSTRMRITFNNQQIQGIKMEQDADITLTPMEKADFDNAHLSRFKWLIETRPKSKEELFK